MGLFDDVLAPKKKRDGLFSDVLKDAGSTAGREILAQADAIGLGKRPVLGSSVPVIRTPEQFAPPEETAIERDRRRARGMAGSVFAEDVPTRTLGELASDTYDRGRIGVRGVAGGLVELANTPQHVINLVNSSANGYAQMLGAQARIPMLPSYDWVRGVQAGLDEESKAIREQMTPTAIRQGAEFESVDGVLPTLGYLVTNPGEATGQLAEQAPQFLAAGLPGGVPVKLAGAGAFAGGQTGAQVGAENQARVKRGEITQAQADALTAQGVAGSAIVNSILPKIIPGGTVLEDALAGNKTGLTRGRGAALGLLGEGLTGGIEEAADQALQNEATGKPVGEGVGKAFALGSIMEGPVGAGAGFLSSGKPRTLGEIPPEELGAAARAAAPPVDAPQTSAIDPAILAAGNEALARAAKNAPPATVPRDPAVAPEPTDDIDALLARNLPPDELPPAAPASASPSSEDAGAAATPEIDWQAAAEALGLPTPSAPNPAASTAQPAEPAAQPVSDDAPVAGSSRGGGDLSGNRKTGPRWEWSEGRGNEFEVGIVERGSHALGNEGVAGGGIFMQIRSGKGDENPLVMTVAPDGSLTTKLANHWKGGTAEQKSAVVGLLRKRARSGDDAERARIADEIKAIVTGEDSSGAGNGQANPVEGGGLAGAGTAAAGAAVQASAAAGGDQASAVDAPTMQNRDRSRAASVLQMQQIRKNPDPERLGFSRDPNTGAPMVGAGKDVPQADKGRADTVVMASGRRVPVQYAVVEADDLAASHDADGRANPDYDAAPLKALNNGRTAGLQAAYATGNAEAYRQGIAADAELHGVSAEAIASKRKPVLVRLYDPAQNTGDMGAESNATQQLGLSPVEQAQTDARALPDLSGMTWNEDGSISPTGNANFFRAWFANLGETQAASLQDAHGRPNAAAIQRVRAAMVQRAYGDERLLTAMAEEVNPDNRNVMNALVQAAPAFAKLDANALNGEIRSAVVGGLELLRDASARGLSLRDAIAQGDLLGRNADADAVARFMAENARSARRMADAFKEMAAYAADAEAQAATLDVFGSAPTPTIAGALNRAGVSNEPRIAEPVGRVAEGRGGGQQTEGGRAATGDAFTLTQDRAPEEAQPAAQVSAGLFGAPTTADFIGAAKRARDASRNGLGRDLVRPEQGDGELLAGGRPAQARVDEASESRQRGEDEADLLELRDAVEAAVGPGRVEYLHDPSGLPDRLRKGVESRMQKRGGKGKTAALYDPVTKKVYLFTGTVTTPSRAVWHVLHEIAGHHGLREFLGDKLAPALEIALQNATVKRVAEAIAKERNIDMASQSGRLLAAEEALAELAAAVRTGNFDAIASRYKVEVPDGMRASVAKAVDNFVKRLKKLLDDMFGRPMFTDEDVRGLLEAAWQAAHGDSAIGQPESALESTEDQTQSEAFKKWFGSSKVVDADGKPLVVYHGSPDARFMDADATFMSLKDRYGDKEGVGAFWIAADRATANSYADDRRAFDYQNAEPAVIAAYLKLENPLVVDGGGKEWREAQAIGKTTDVIEKAKAEGHDGVIIRNVRDNYNNGPRTKPTDTYVVFNSRQIKSADKNNGNFDPDNPSILESVEYTPEQEAAPFDKATATGASVLRDGRLLSLIDAVKAEGGDLSGLTEAIKSRDVATLTRAIDASLAAMRPKPRVTGTKNAVTDAERMAAGRDPILREAVQSNEETVVRAMRELREDPTAGDEAVARLSRDGVEAISVADEAILLVHKTELLNKREAAAKKLADPNASEATKDVARQAWAEAEAKIAQLDLAASNAGREWGRFGQFRQRMMREDFTLAALERKERARLERPLTPEESATVKAMADQIAALQEKLDRLQERAKNAESEWAYETMTRRIERPRRAQDAISSLRQRADDARRRLRATPEVQSRNRQSGAIISPTVFADLATIGAYHVANGAAKLVDWVAAMRADVGDWFDGLKADHANIFNAAKREAEQADRFEDTPADVLEKIDLGNIGPKDVRKLIAAHVGAGLRGESAVIEAAAKDLGLAEDEVRALFIQSVPRAEQSLTEAKQELADLRKLVRLQAEIDRLEAGLPKPKPGAAPRVDSPAVAERKRELAEVRKRLRPVRDPEGRYQEMRAKQIAKRIKELEARIAAGDFAPRPRVPRALSDANQRAMFELDKAKEAFLRHQFEDNLRKRTPIGKAFGLVGDTFNLARAMMTSLDLSAILRQGGFIAYGHPLRAMSSIGPSLRAFVSEANEHALNTEITSRKNAPLYKKYGLQLTGIGAGPLTQIEEAYASRWLSKLPWWTGGGLVRGSGRAYTAFLNKLRADSFDAMAATLALRSVPTEAEGKAIANYINVATGRGKVGVKEQSAQALNTVFFAPRLVASRFQLLAGQPLYGGTSRTRKLVAQEYARFAIGVSVALALTAFALVGSDDDEDKPIIGLDPRSADFLKIRVGNTYIDPMAGLAQVTTFLAREITGETVTGKGEVKPLRTGYTLTDLRRALGSDIPAHKLGKDGRLPFGSGSAADVLGRFLRTKLAPVPGAIVNVLSGSNAIGEPVTPASAAVEMVTPMSFQNIADIMEEQGIPKGTAITTLGLLGMGVQHRLQSNAQQFAEFNDGIAAVRSDVKERLKSVPVERWPAEMEALRKEYGPAMEGLELQYYKADGKYGDAGEPRRDADGNPVLKSTRISDNYREVSGAGDDQQAHHVIPDNLARHHPLMAQARSMGYDLDRASNLLNMPKQAGGADIAHRTSHPDYDAEVFGLLQAAEKRLKKAHGSLKDAPPSEVLDEVRKIEDEMRGRIQRKDVPTKDGRLAVLTSTPLGSA